MAALSTAAARLAQEVDEAVAEVSGVDEALDRICVDFEAGIDDLARARQDLAEVKIKIARPLAAPTMTDADDLASQLHHTGLGLDEARRQATSGDRASAVRLAAALGPAAADLRAAAHALAASAGASLARRRELRGRLDAYRSKAYGLGRAEDPTLIELYRLTQDSLYRRPVRPGRGRTAPDPIPERGAGRWRPVRRTERPDGRCGSIGWPFSRRLVRVLAVAVIRS